MSKRKLNLRKERDSEEDDCKQKKFKGSTSKQIIDADTNVFTTLERLPEIKENELRNANLFIETVSEIFAIDYENPSTTLLGYADDETFKNKDNDEEASIQEDFYVTFMKAIKENEWGFVFNSLTTRFNSTLLPPTIIIRCIFHFILTTNDKDLLDCAIIAISSLWDTHRPSKPYAKKYYQKLFLQSENLNDFPSSIKGKLFNDIFDQLLCKLLGKANPPSNTTIAFENSEPLEQSEESQDICGDDDDDEDIPAPLTPQEELSRIVIAYRLLLDLLEQDFIEFIVKYKKEPKKCIFVKSRQPIIVKLNIPDLETVLEAFHSCDNDEYRRDIARYINLLAEATKVQDLEEEKMPGAASVIKHPCFGKRCIKFANMLARAIIPSESSLKEKIQVLAMFQPWLQMFIYCHWLTERTGITADPSITFVVRMLKLCLKEVPEATDPGLEVKASKNKEKDSSVLKMHNKQLLLKHNINKKNLNRRNQLGETKLIEMCRTKKPEVVKAILSLPDVDVNVCCNAGWTALHEASTSGDVGIVRMLLQYVPSVPDLKPVDVCASNPNGTTALHEAAESGFFEICKLLVEKGGPKVIEMETKKGVKPINNTSNEIQCYFKQVLEENETILLRNHLMLEISEFDLVLLREITFAYIDVYSLYAIMRTYNQKLCNTYKNNAQSNRKHKDRAKLKIDFKSVSDNVKAFNELKSILKCVFKKTKQTELSGLINDWLLAFAPNI